MMMAPMVPLLLAVLSAPAVDAGILRNRLREQALPQALVEQAHRIAAAGPAAAPAAASPATPPHHLPHDNEHSGTPGNGGQPMVPRSHVPVGHEIPSPEHWSYTAPNVWGVSYPQCNGEGQSPVNIEWVTAHADAYKEDVEYIATHASYQPLTNRSISNTGHNVQVNGDFGSLALPDGEYEVRQFHFHFPSEHEINGKLAAGEIHIVHQKQGSSGTEDLAVVAILLETNEHIKEELDFLENLGFGGQLPKQHETLYPPEAVDLNALDSTFRLGFWHYRGSLTTPPCSETVHWYVMQQPASVTPQMVLSFKAMFPSPSNNRPVQPLNERDVIFSEAGEPGEFAHSPRPKAYHPKSAALGASALTALLAAGLGALLP